MTIVSISHPAQIATIISVAAWAADARNTPVLCSGHASRWQIHIVIPSIVTVVALLMRREASAVDPSASKVGKRWTKVH